MSKKSVIRSLYILIFLIILLASFACVRPIHRALTENISHRVQTMRTMLEDTTGLTFSYASLSPSILTVFNIKGIVLSSAADGKALVSIRRITLRYRLLKLLQGDIDSAFKSLTIDGVAVDYDDAADRAIIEKIASFTKEGGAKRNAKRTDFSRISVDLPFSLLIKNVRIRYRSAYADASFTIRSAEAVYNEASRSLGVSARGSSDAVLYGAKGMRVSGKYTLSSSVRSGLNGSSLVARFSNMTGGDFSFGRLSFRASYDDRVISVRTFQSAFPLMMSASYDIDSKKAEASFAAERFRLSSFISSRRRADFVRRIGEVSLTAKGSAEYDAEQKSLSYTSGGSFFVPETIVRGSLSVRYDVSGTKDEVSIPHLVVSGENCDAEASLLYRFDGMRLSGIVDAKRIALPNGNVLSAELYFDPLDRGFVCFAPEVHLGEKNFTALEARVIPNGNSVDYSFELSDYAHAEADTPGSLRIDGSWLSRTNYMQAGIDINNFYLDSAAEAGAFFLPKSNSASLSSFAPRLAPYVFTGELYVSSDLKSISYNAPYALFVNTQRENEALFLSFDGNESSLQVSQLNVVYKGDTFSASAEIDRAPDSSASFFTLDVLHKSVPYHFTGNIMPNVVSVSGDYNLAAEFQRYDNGSMEGSLAMENFPLQAFGTIFTLSTEAGFAYTKDEGFAVHIARLESEDAGGKFSFSPHVLLSGTVTKYGAVFDSVSYTDSFSALTGSSQCTVNMSDSGFESAHIDMTMTNPLSKEAVTASAEINNPDRAPLSVEMLKKNLYFNADVLFGNIDLNRFVTEQSENNRLTASMSATGTVENPYVTLSVDDADVMLAGVLLSANGSATLEDRNLSVNSMHLSYGRLLVDNVRAGFSFSSYTGNASADITTTVMKKSVKLPLSLAISDTAFQKRGAAPLSFALTLSSPGASGSFFVNPFPFSLTLLYTEGNAFITSSPSLGVSGSITDTGVLDLRISNDRSFRSGISGTITSQKLDIRVSDVSVDLAAVMSHISNDIVTIYNGVLIGEAHIGGLLSDPEFSGSFSVEKPDFNFPKVIPSHITQERFFLLMDHNEITLPPVTMGVRDSSIDVAGKIYFDRWTFDRLEATVRTPPNKTAPADLDIDIAEFNGMARVDLRLSLQDKIFDVTGKVYVEDVKAKFRMPELLKERDVNYIIPVRANVDITFGPHVNLVFDPLLRCVFVPGDSINVKVDQTNDSFSIAGDMHLRSGDIAYLNRNFYLRQGLLRFSDTDEAFNPRITVRAEVRERDANGGDIRIILTAENQPLLDFNPQVSSIPAKSEAEIRTLLGQIVAADSGNMRDIFIATTDYAVQSTIGRAIENKLRDWLNFDIFSVRTTVLQNTLRMGFSGDLSRRDLSAGNFLDNSTVYIGKYFGSVLYADALMHLVYDKTRVDDSTTVQGITFQPEFGFELEAPFVNIRWDMTPDITAILNNVIVPSTALTLSWRFSF
ncbi:translocation/assembly module TamB domain-containing protein [Treponema socranskii]|uniref:translocation/assembly module TamB domain-containing protein n=1 Tax=Treponema socranskii TaxID=53419 RepID=UPI003D8B73AE